MAQTLDDTEEDSEGTLAQRCEESDNRGFRTLSDVTKEHVHDTREETLKRFVHDLRGFAEDEEVTQITKAVAETAGHLNLGGVRVTGRAPRGGARGAGTGTRRCRRGEAKGTAREAKGDPAWRPRVETHRAGAAEARAGLDGL